MCKDLSSVVLLSGGLDSGTLLFWARRKSDKVLALIFEYGQRHKKEIEFAKKLCGYADVDYEIVKVDFPRVGSALLDTSLNLPQREINEIKNEIPITYVPSRNIIFLSLACSFAEAYNMDRVYIGANVIDYSGYPDCRPEFIDAFNSMLAVGTKRGVLGSPIKVVAPFISLSKAEIIKIGLSLGVPYQFTWSCYSGAEYPCGTCDSCKLRKKAFMEVGIDDPLFSNAK